MCVASGEVNEIVKTKDVGLTWREVYPKLAAARFASARWVPTDLQSRLLWARSVLGPCCQGVTHVGFDLQLLPVNSTFSP